MSTVSREKLSYVHTLKAKLRLKTVLYIRHKASCALFLSSDHLWVLFPDVFMVVTSEVAVDIIKHAFITKFNDITADVRTKPDYT